MSTFIQQSCRAVKQAMERGTPLRIEGGGSKAFYGRETSGQVLRTGGHRGVVHYEPSELVVTVRAGTVLTELEQELRVHGQMLPFEPPRFAPGATIGGTIASGLAGPRRPYAGAVRDALLGCEIINGFGEALTFGGQVMKNVAGYDISRLMAGALGTLGIVVQASIKLLPLPEVEATRVFELSQAQAVEAMNRWAGLPLPLSGAYHDGESLYVRLSGTSVGVASAAHRLGGEPVEDPNLWSKVRDHTHSFFQDTASLWRVSVPPAAPPLGFPGPALIEWGGALRWLAGTAPAQQIREVAAAAGGHATWFRGHDGNDVFHPLADAKRVLHRNLKRAFDPAGILNPGRLYAGL